MHLATFSTSDAGKLIAHDERSIGPREHITKDAPVYDLAPAYEGGAQVHYHDLIADLDLSAKARPLASFMVTMPDAVPLERGREFFQAAYDFLAKEVGEQNVVSAYVHLDEPGARPHMAVKFVPRVDTPVMTNDKTRPLCWTKADEKKNRAHKAGEQKRDNKGTLRWERVPKLDENGQPVMRHTATASKMFSKARLTALHPKMEQELCKVLGMEKVGIVLDEDDERKRFSRMDHETFVKVTAAEQKAKAGLEEVQGQQRKAEENGQELQTRAQQGKSETAAARARTRELEEEVSGLRAHVGGLETTLRRVVNALRRVPAALEMAAQALPEGFMQAIKSFEDGLKAVEPEPKPEPDQEQEWTLDDLMENYSEVASYGSYRGSCQEQDIDL